MKSYSKFLLFLMTPLIFFALACQNSKANKGKKSSAAVLSDKAWLDQEEIENTVLVRNKRIGYCFQYFYGKADPSKEQLSLKWQIGSDGYVGSVSVENSSLGGSRVEQCIVGLVGRWKFRAAPESQTMMAAHKFNFNNLKSR